MRHDCKRCRASPRIPSKRKMWETAQLDEPLSAPPQRETAQSAGLGHLFAPEPRQVGKEAEGEGALVERMLALHQQLAAANTPTAKTVLQRQIGATDRQTDRLIYELYGLSEEEIRIVEGATA